MPQHRRRVYPELRLQLRHAFQCRADITLLGRRAHKVNECFAQSLFQCRHRWNSTPGRLPKKSELRHVRSRGLQFS